jgi:hypothetical protein
MAMTDIAPRVCVRAPGSDFNPYAGGTPEVCLVSPVNAFVKRDRSNDRITTMLPRHDLGGFQCLLCVVLP